LPEKLGRESKNQMQNEEKYSHTITGNKTFSANTEVVRSVVDRFWITEEISQKFQQQLLMKPQWILEVYCGERGWESEKLQAHLRTRRIQRYPFQMMMSYAHGLQVLNTLEWFDLFLLHLAHEEDKQQFFDIISLSYIEAYTRTEDFIFLLKRLLKHCRRGGFLRWQEGELPETTSVAYTQFCYYIVEALGKCKRGIMPLIPYSTTTALMGGWLLSAGCGNIVKDDLVVDVSAGQPLHDSFVYQMSIIALLLKPLLLKLDMLTEAEIDDLRLQMEEEFADPLFEGTCWIHTVWGTY